MYNKNSVIYYYTDQYYKTQHCNNVKGLIGDKKIYKEYPDKSAGRSQGYAEHDDKGIEKVFEQGRHEQIAYHYCQDKVPHKGLPCFCQVICCTTKLNTIEAGKVAALSYRFNYLFTNNIHCSL